MKLSNFNWSTALFVIIYHLLLIVWLPIYFIHSSPPSGVIWASALLYFITGMGITAGYHRFYAHSTYKTNVVVEAILLFFGTVATQNSALKWSFDHRNHHAFVDTDRDPYSIKKGFWYAHLLWIFEKSKGIENKVVSDLLKNPLVRFQHRFYIPLMLITNAMVILFIGWCFNDYLAAFLIAGLARLFLVHHCTWFINSLAHTWGARTFCQELSAVDNYIISLLALGEGYHNYHHAFASDYRNGIRWYHFDPTKWLIWTLGLFGLTKNLKKNQSDLIQERIFLDRKELLLEKIDASFGEYKGIWEEKITHLTESVVEKLRQIKQLREHYKSLKKTKTEKKEYLKELYNQMKTIKKEFKQDCKRWMAHSRYVLQIYQIKLKNRHLGKISALDL